MRQMKAKIALVLSLAIILFVVYLMYFKGGEAFAVQEPGAVEDIVQPTQQLPERTVSPGGPNSPALRAPPEEGDTPVVLPGPEHRDPYAQSQQVSNFGDDARSPERMFGPAPLPTITDIGTASGAMSRILSDAPATQQFATEAAQNGGEFIDGGVFANDTDVPKNFSAF
jgi:hypothetical protein